MFVKDRMSTPVHTIEVNVDYTAALARMQLYGVRHLPVVNAVGELVGIVAERDLVSAGVVYQQCPVAVSECMESDVVTVAAGSPLPQAAMRMLNHRIGALPVVDSAKQVVGIITASDIFRAFVQGAPEETVGPHAETMMS